MDDQWKLRNYLCTWNIQKTQSRILRYFVYLTSQIAPNNFIDCIFEYYDLLEISLNECGKNKWEKKHNTDGLRANPMFYIYNYDYEIIPDNTLMNNEWNVKLICY